MAATCPPCHRPTRIILNGCAWCQESCRLPSKCRKTHRCHDAVVAVDQAVITVQNADDLHLVAHALIQRFGHAADGCTFQAGAVTAGCQIPTRIFIETSLSAGAAGSTRTALLHNARQCAYTQIFYLYNTPRRRFCSMRCGGQGGNFINHSKPGRIADAGFLHV